MGLRLATVLVLCFSGCALAQSASHTEEPEEELFPLLVPGRYGVATSLSSLVSDLGAGSPAIDVLRELREPAAYLADAVADEVDLPKAVLETIIDRAIGEEDDQLRKSIDDVLDLQVGWQLHTRLQLDYGGIESGEGMSMTHYAEALNTVIDAQDRLFELDKPDLGTLVRSEASFSEPTLSAPKHPVPLHSMAMLAAVLENELAPSIAPGADDLGDALLTVVDCVEVGDDIEDIVNEVPGVNVNGKQVCEAGVRSAGKDISDKILDLKDHRVELELVGTADASDHSGDSVVDVIQGSWFVRVATESDPAMAPFKGLRGSESFLLP